MKRFISLLAGLVVCVCASAQNDGQLLRSWIQTLASDEFGGRKPMTEHETLTVNYLAKELEQMGLEPAFEGSWFQPFQLIAVTANKYRGRGPQPKAVGGAGVKRSGTESPRHPTSLPNIHKKRGQLTFESTSFLSQLRTTCSETKSRTLSRRRR